MKKLLLLSFILLLTYWLSAQESDWSLGMQTSYYQTHFVKSPLQGEKTADQSLAAGLTVSKKLNQKVTFYGGLNISSFGDSYYANELRWGTQHDGQGGFDPGIDPGEDISTVQFNWKYFYLNTRIGINAYFNEGRFRVFCYPFAEGNFYLTNNRTTTLQYLDGQIENQPVEKNLITDFRKFNISVGMGLGLEANLSRRVGIYLMPNTSYMLRGMSRDAANGARYWSVGGTLGLNYRL